MNSCTTCSCLISRRAEGASQQRYWFNCNPYCFECWSEKVPQQTLTQVPERVLARFKEDYKANQ